MNKPGVQHSLSSSKQSWPTDCRRLHDGAQWVQGASAGLCMCMPNKGALVLLQEYRIHGWLNHLMAAMP